MNHKLAQHASAHRDNREKSTSEQCTKHRIKCQWVWCTVDPFLPLCDLQIWPRKPFPRHSSQLLLWPINRMSMHSRSPLLQSSVQYCPFPPFVLYFLESFSVGPLSSILCGELQRRGARIAVLLCSVWHWRNYCTRPVATVSMFQSCWMKNVRSTTFSFTV